jgi:hypothetical protein
MPFTQPFSSKIQWESGIRDIAQLVMQIMLMNKMFPGEQAGTPQPNLPPSAMMGGMPPQTGLQGPMAGPGFDPEASRRKQGLMQILAMFGGGFPSIRP